MTPPLTPAPGTARPPLGDPELRAGVLASLGAIPSEVAELLAYNPSHLDPARDRPRLPLPDEPFVAAWEGYAAEAEVRGAFAVLRERLVQLRFPIQEGITTTDAYRAATRRGVPPDDLAEATGLALRRSDLLRLVI